MSLLTKDKLEAMFNQSKLRQQKKREQKKLETKQRLQAIYHHQDQVLKKSIQERKKTTMDNLSKLIKKTQEKPQKPAQNEFYVYNERYRERYTDEDELYTLDELKNIEELYPNETGRIRWDVWEKVVNETKREIEEHGKH